MELDFSKKEKIVGTFIIGIIVLLLAAVVIVGRGKNWFATQIDFYTIFDESYNLEENAAVKLFKTDIGKVKRITLVENKVRVELAILENYRLRIREDATAIVESPTFIGSEYVSIIPGTGEAELIAEGGEITSKAKKSITDILNEFEVEKTAKMVVKAVQEISEVSQTLTDPNGPLWRTLDHVERTTSHIESITAEIEQGKGTIGELLRSRELIDAIMANVDKIEPVIDSIRAAAEKTPIAMDRVNNTLKSAENAGEGIQVGVETITRILEEVSISVRTLDQILNNIRIGSEDVPTITRTTKNGIKEIREGVENVDKVVKSLQNSFLIRQNLPPEPVGESTDSGLRQ
ncbi:MAG: MCE family protein [Desulfobacteraceae bacterium]|nr:MCE family protein [Desulfobacteraceae bacterium]